MSALVTLIAGLALLLVLPCIGALAANIAPVSAMPAEPESTLDPILSRTLASMRYGLKHADIENYRRLFDAADSGDWNRALLMSSLVEDRRLIGHALAGRYLAPGANPNFSDLRAWLDLYGDHPEADDIYHRAVARQPDKETAVPQPRGSQNAGHRAWERDAPGSIEPREGAGERALSARWMAGLAAWRLGRFPEAGRHFTALATSHLASTWMAAAASYWAGRVEERSGGALAALKWFGSASRFPTTFYGLLALRKLGLDIGHRAVASSVTTDHLDSLAENPAGYRAIALLEIGRRALAADELERIDADGDPRLEEALIVVADAAHLGQFSPSLAQRIAQPAGETIRRRYPIPNWRPQGGFKIDPALVYAVARQESRFDAAARSPSGAAGLMQIMPDTATAVAPKEQKSLFDPSTNLDVGQRYIRALMRDPEIGDNLLLLTEAYNGGSGNPAKFRRMLLHDDPLLAVESLPHDATREYIQHVIANYWIYSARLGGDTTSLTDLAAGRWPIYRWDDGARGLAAAR